MSFRSKLLSLCTALTFVAALGGTAVAGDEEEKKPEPEEEKAEAEPEKRRAPAEASVEAQATTKVEDRQPVEAGDSFEAGNTVFIWNRVKGAKDSTIRHIWKRNGNQIAEISLDIGSHNWRTWSRSGVSSGEYEVDVVAEDDQVLATVAFTVE
jgi:hypothetical protein